MLARKLAAPVTISKLKNSKILRMLASVFPGKNCSLFVGTTCQANLSCVCILFSFVVSYLRIWFRFSAYITVKAIGTIFPTIMKNIEKPFIFVTTSAT